MSSKLQLHVVSTVRGSAIWWTQTKAKRRHGVYRLNCVIHVWVPWGRDACHLRHYINALTFTFMCSAASPTHNSESVDGAGAHCQGAVQLLPAAACIVSVNRWRQPRPSLSGVSASSSKPSTRSDNSLCLSGSTVLLMLYVYSCQYNSV